MYNRRIQRSKMQTGLNMCEQAHTWMGPKFEASLVFRYIVEPTQGWGQLAMFHIKPVFVVPRDVRASLYRPRLRREAWARYRYSSGGKGSHSALGFSKTLFLLLEGRVNS